MDIRYRLEYHPNKDCVTVHIGEVVPFKPGTTRHHVTGDVDERLTQLSEIRGIESASSFEKYQISIVKASVFAWEEILPVVIFNIGELIGGKMVNSAKDILPERAAKDCYYDND